jgi:hypothetical protein
MKAVPGRRRYGAPPASAGLAGTGLPPVSEGVDQVLHGLTRHVGISFGQSCLATQQPYGTPGTSLSASPAPEVLAQRAPRRRLSC